VTPDVLAAIAEHAQESAPAECCGILLAQAGTVTDMLRSRNTEGERPTRRYRLDPRVQLAALDAEIEGRALIAGYYHSHPVGPPSPSPTDVAEAVPETTYLICGLATGRPEFAAWRSEEGRLAPEPLEATDA
jgi:proteasome lid subunit RPN8/RPN11